VKSCLQFIVDKLTNSIEEVKSGLSFTTEILLVTKKEISKVHKKDGWLFNWKKEFQKSERKAYKLVLTGEERIQGLISIEPVPDQLYVEMHLIENEPHNISKEKEFIGVAGNLVAFAYKTSFDLGFDGFVAFPAKTELMEHYSRTLGAEHIYGNTRMAIFTESAKKLVNSY
jgi:hypothetical protein